jgi:hypothetical protein
MTALTPLNYDDVRQRAYIAVLADHERYWRDCLSIAPAMLHDGIRPVWLAHYVALRRANITGQVRVH